MCAKIECRFILELVYDGCTAEGGVSHNITLFVVLRNTRKNVFKFVWKQGRVLIWRSIHKSNNDVFPMGNCNLHE